jgi:hypothetical protein
MTGKRLGIVLPGLGSAKRRSPQQLDSLGQDFAAAEPVPDAWYIMLWNASRSTKTGRPP